MTERTLAFLNEHGARTLAIDARDYPEVHPLLTPLLLNLVTQWFTVWSADIPVPESRRSFRLAQP